MTLNAYEEVRQVPRNQAVVLSMRGDGLDEIPRSDPVRGRNIFAPAIPGAAAFPVHSQPPAASHENSGVLDTTLQDTRHQSHWHPPRNNNGRDAAFA